MRITKASREVKNQTKQIPTKSIPEEAILSQENSTEESVVILIKKTKTYRCHQTRN
jgi:hypothetical protein